HTRGAAPYQDRCRPTEPWRARIRTWGSIGEASAPHHAIGRMREQLLGDSGPSRSNLDSASGLRDYRLPHPHLSKWRPRAAELGDHALASLEFLGSSCRAKALRTAC